jgi:hypothetical protein
VSALRPEVELLFMTALARVGPADVAAVREFVQRHADRLDWGFVIDQAYQHKVLPLIAGNFLDYHLYPSMDDHRLRFRHEQLFRFVAEGNAMRNETVLRELSLILRELAEHGIPVVVRKGPVLMQEVYGQTRSRLMNDLDLMVDPADLDRTCGLLADLGYAQGKPTANRRALRPLTRTEAIYAKLKVPNVNLKRPTSERFVTYFNLDICLNHFLPDSGYSLPAGRLAERARPIRLFGSPALAFTPEEMLIDLSVHLYKEATTLQYIAIGKDLCLSKFLDIAEYVRSGPAVDWAAFLDRCRGYGIEQPVYYGLHFTDVLYPEVLPPDVLDALRPDDPGFLHRFGDADKVAGEWRGDFLTRMFDGSRSSEVHSRALV